jgi:hypothetical protein
VGRRWRLDDNAAADDSRHYDDSRRDGSAREPQLSQHGEQWLVELERGRLRARRADEPLTTAGLRAADPARRPSSTVSRVTQAPALTTQLLEWLDEQPRSYSETLDAWKTSCPRLSIWEDALADRLIRIEAGNVHVTPAGKARLV